jgi:hypothetical protein
MRAHHALLGCALACRATVPAGVSPTADTLRPSEEARGDATASADAVRALEGRCRQGLQEETVRDAMAALDRVRLALGAVCDLVPVDDDPLHWRFACRSDALFDPGQYGFRADASAPCPALPGAARGVNRWVCAGAILRGLTASAARGGTLEVAVVGHVDHVQIARFDTCQEVRGALSFDPSPAWVPVTPGAAVDDATRDAANQELSWCRAGNVSRQLRCGMALAQANRAPAAGGDPCAGLAAPAELVVTSVGAGTRWLDRHGAGACSPSPSGAPPGDCAEARRVDVLVRYAPAAQAVGSRCTYASGDSAGALACLQQCLEDRAARRLSVSRQAVGLYRRCAAARVGAPEATWLQSVAGLTGPCREVDPVLVERVLGL